MERLLDCFRPLTKVWGFQFDGKIYDPDTEQFPSPYEAMGHSIVSYKG